MTPINQLFFSENEKKIIRVITYITLKVDCERGVGAYLH